MSESPTIQPITPFIFELNWPVGDLSQNIQSITAAELKLKKTYGRRLLQTIRSYQKLLLHFRAKQNKDTLMEIRQCLNQGPDAGRSHRSKTYTIPVLYDGLDLHPAAESCGLSVNGLLKLHHSPTYLVCFYGFMPGFMYLNGLPEKIHLPRKQTPKRKVSAGSVAIGGAQTGIYPRQSPGGWHILGQTPLDIFRVNRTPPVIPAPGDKIRFKPISENAFNTIKNQVQSGNYHWQHE